jgi:probable phosphoglycerate mutase
MTKLTLRFVAILVAVLVVSFAEERFATAQPTTSSSDDWKPPQRRRIILMRHGDVSYFDAQGQPVSDSDKVTLSDKGRAQADAAGTYLKRIGFAKFDRVISSTLPRTVETAERVMKVLGQAGEPTEVEALREIRIGSSQEIHDIPTSELPQDILGMMQPRVSGEQSLLRGETIAALQARVFPATDALLVDKGWDTALWVLHGGVNLAILGRALTSDDSLYGRFDLGPGCFSIVDVGTSFRDAVIKAVNVCPDPAPYAPRLDTLEMLLMANLRARAAKP